MKKKIGVIGIGNPLRRDDGIGVLLLAQLRTQKKALPTCIDYIDGGTGGMNLLHVLSLYKRILIIDAVDFGGRPGESRMVSLQDLRDKKKSVSLSTHESDFLNVMRLAEELHQLPESVSLFGIQPKDVTFGTTLSEEITSEIALLIKTLQDKIRSLVI